MVMVMVAGYKFVSTVWRAQPLYVVDGDTADLFVDRGWHTYALERFRFLGIDTPELRGGTDESKAKAREARELVRVFLARVDKTYEVNLKTWPLRIESAPDTDNFGRWLCRIFFMREDVEVSVNAELLKRGLAVPFMV